eukprot:6481083-Amphidinium_carterae.1
MAGGTHCWHPCPRVLLASGQKNHEDGWRPQEDASAQKKGEDGRRPQKDASAHLPQPCLSSWCCLSWVFNGFTRVSLHCLSGSLCQLREHAWLRPCAWLCALRVLLCAVCVRLCDVCVRLCVVCAHLHGLAHCSMTLTLGGGAFIDACASLCVVCAQHHGLAHESMAVTHAGGAPFATREYPVRLDHPVIIYPEQEAEDSDDDSRLFPRFTALQPLVVRECISIPSEVVGNIPEGGVIRALGNTTTHGRIERCRIMDVAPTLNVVGWITLTARNEGGP